ncbi:MAG: tetratricopeptide repeat protein [Cytophagales bacterium]|nr:tetratricopeptide repeat protein [Cytophagales bacterium]
MRQIVYVILCFFAIAAIAQKGGLPLADEYYDAGEYEKAITFYVNFTDNVTNATKVYDKYLHCLTQLKKYEEAEKFHKKMIKWDNNPKYLINLAQFYHTIGKPKEEKKLLDKIIDDCKKYPETSEAATTELNKKKYYTYSKIIYQNLRKIQKNDYLYTYEMAEIYKNEGNTSLMIQELLRHFVVHINDKETIKANWQQFITTDAEFDALEKIIIEKIQDEPTAFHYADLLIWIYIQQKKFQLAFIQSKAYDKVLRLQGNKIMETGMIVMENKKYDLAAEIFEYISKEYTNTPNYPVARKLKIEARENIIKSTYPIDKRTLQNLANDYKKYILEMGKTPTSLEAMRNLALLYAFYLDAKDSAQTLMEDIIQQPWADRQLADRCKLELGDIYILKNEPWEATLVYAQVEKSQKETPLGHEAKLRGAKLDYYKGEFELAKESADVLKLATSREIANDAVDLSLFIQVNTGTDEDSTHEALREYASVELLLFQNKYGEALARLDSMLLRYKNHSIIDEIYYLKAKTYYKTTQYTQAVACLEIIDSIYKSDIYGDDGSFLKARIYEENLNDIEKAKELYNKFLLDYPASIYTAEARKRYRALRGDNLN